MARRRQALSEAVQQLKSATDAETDAQLLLAHVLRLSKLSLLVSLDEAMTDAECNAFNRLLALRESGLPLQYVLSEAHFMGHSFYVDRRVLIPRFDTERLCEAAIQRLRTDCHVLELGTGSGAIAISIALACPVHIVAVDISDEALAVARINGAKLTANVAFLQSDLFSSVHGLFDIILSNPPYIPDAAIGSLPPEVRMEPSIALRGGTDGLCFYRRMMEGLKDHLALGGSLLLEVGDGQAEQVAQMLQDHFDKLSILRDYNQLDRVVIGDGYAG